MSRRAPAIGERVIVHGATFIVGELHGDTVRARAKVNLPHAFGWCTVRKDEMEWDGGMGAWRVQTVDHEHKDGAA